MAHELKPRSGALPAAREIARLLSVEFSYVKTDAEAGKERGLALASRLESVPARVFGNDHDRVREHIARLRDSSPDDALVIEFGDSAAHAVSIVALPNEPVRFGYRSPRDERRLATLVQRCARILDCELVEI